MKLIGFFCLIDLKFLLALSSRNILLNLYLKKTVYGCRSITGFCQNFSWLNTFISSLFRIKLKHLCRLFFGFDIFSWLSAPDLFSLMCLLSEKDWLFSIFFVTIFWLSAFQASYLMSLLSTTDGPLLPIFDFDKISWLSSPE